MNIRFSIMALAFIFLLCSWPCPVVIPQNIAELKFYSDIFAWYPDGSVKRLSQGDGIYYQPSIDPDGTCVVYYGNSSGPPRIWKAELRRGRVVPLTSADWAAYHPSYSWDGKRIVFASDKAWAGAHGRIEEIETNGNPPKNRTCHIFTMNATGGNIVQITHGDYTDQRPAFSPDGKNIVFVSNRTGSPHEIYVVSSNGKGEPRPLLADTWGYRPWYSKDGKWIYFFSTHEGRDEVFRIPSNGGHPVHLPNNVEGNSHGVFIDNSGKFMLVHSRMPGGKSSIYEIPLDGGEPRKLEPPGFDYVTHPGRSKNGIVVFDVIRGSRK